MKKIMILGASILQLPAIKKAKEMGLSVVAVDINPDAIGLKVPGIETEIISTIDIPGVLEAAKRHKIDGIMTLASDMPMRTVAVVAEEMGLIGISEDTALKATNKIYMRQTLKDNGVPVPIFFRVSTIQEMHFAVKNLQEKGFRCIIKPADNSGSRGVTLLKNYEQATVEKAFLRSKQYSRSGDIVVEEYMTGPEVSVETLSIDGKCYVIQITDKLTTGAPYFVEMGHSQPSRLPETIRKQIAEVAAAAVTAIGIQNGPSHTEIKITKDGPKIVELGARLGGDCITTHLVPLSTGVDMVEFCINIALGNKPKLECKFSRGAAIRFFKTEFGQIRSVSGVQEARDIPGVIQVSITRNVGDKAEEIKSSTDRVGFVIASAENAHRAVNICNTAIDRIAFNIE